LADWFVHDAEPWGDSPVPAGELRRIVGCVRRRRRIEIHLAGRAPALVEPLGLVLKAGSWHLVVVRGETADVLGLDTLQTPG
jgi:hypothetical protein